MIVVCKFSRASLRLSSAQRFPCRCSTRNADILGEEASSRDNAGTRSMLQRSYVASDYGACVL